MNLLKLHEAAYTQSIYFEGRQFHFVISSNQHYLSADDVLSCSDVPEFNAQHVNTVTFIVEQEDLLDALNVMVAKGGDGEMSVHARARIEKEYNTFAPAKLLLHVSKGHLSVFGQFIDTMTVTFCLPLPVLADNPTALGMPVLQSLAKIVEFLHLVPAAKALPYAVGSTLTLKSGDVGHVTLFQNTIAQNAEGKWRATGLCWFKNHADTKVQAYSINELIAKVNEPEWPVLLYSFKNHYETKTLSYSSVYQSLQFSMTPHVPSVFFCDDEYFVNDIEITSFNCQIRLIPLVEAIKVAIHAVTITKVTIPLSFDIENNTETEFTYGELEVSTAKYGLFLRAYVYEKFSGNRIGVNIEADSLLDATLYAGDTALQKSLAILNALPELVEAGVIPTSPVTVGDTITHEDGQMYTVNSVKTQFSDNGKKGLKMRSFYTLGGAETLEIELGCATLN